ncbi:MAG: hypothetical protein ACPGF7_03410 [Pontibacterium sp.]
MLPKPLYESLPYFCLVSGALSTALPTDALHATSGLILYCIGATVFILRSRHRRVDAKTNNIRQNRQRYIPWQKGSLFPEPLYEAIPFLYILCGILLQCYARSALLIYSGFIVFAIGVVILALRHSYRVDKRKHPVQHMDM